MVRSTLLLGLVCCMIPLGNPGALIPDARADNLERRPNDKLYTIDIGPAVANRGQAIQVPVVFHAAKGWRIAQEFAVGLKVFPPAGITAGKAYLDKSDAKLSAHEGQFEVLLTGTEVGKKLIPAALVFTVCHDQNCDPQVVRIQIEMDVR